MADRVGFTKASARRIADVVRRVERMPEELPGIQRRRAGGRGLDMLWEVTAVQTGPQTCTIKRVEDIGGTLNDPSEQTDVLFDPNNEPPIGDQGLMLSLADGTRFFFRRQAVSANIPIPNLAHVEEVSPDTNFSAGPVYFISHRETGKQILIGRFSQQLSGDASGILFPASHIISTLRRRNGPIENVPGPSVTGVYRVHEITDDFDIATITYNIYTGLTTNEVVNLPFELNSRGGTIDILEDEFIIETLHGRSGMPPSVDHHILGFNQKDSSTAITFSGAYGLAVEADVLLARNLTSFLVSCSHRSVEIGAIGASTIDRRPYITSQGLVGTNYNPL